MKSFDETINELHALRGKKIQPINPSSSPLRLVEVDQANGNYIIENIENTKATKRSFSELKQILDALNKEGVVHVDTVLKGSGSSRSQPETLFAQLTDIFWFKYKNKKHLYRSSVQTHKLGELKELSGPELDEIKKILKNKKLFSEDVFVNNFKSTLTGLEESIGRLEISYAGKELKSLNSTFSKFKELYEKIALTRISYIRTLVNDSMADTSRLFDDPFVTGFESGSDGEEITEEKDLPENSVNKENFVAPTVNHLVYSVATMYDRIIHEDIILQPSFQRTDRIWKLKQKSELIESILLGFPVPSLFCAGVQNGKWLMVDGLQRMTTVQDFLDNKFKLSGLDLLDHLNGENFESLKRPLQRRIREYQFHVELIDSGPGNSKSAISQIFQRLNTNGAILSAQEVRSALYDGNSVAFLRYITRHPSFLEVTLSKVSSKRQKDIEFALGAIAYGCLGYEDYDYNKLDLFLQKMMEQMNKFTFALNKSNNNNQGTGEPLVPSWEECDPFYSDLKDSIVDAFKLSISIFGQNRFQKSEDSSILSKPLFELIVSVFMNLTEAQKQKIRSNRHLVKTGLNDLIEGRKKYVGWVSEHYEKEKRDFLYALSTSTGKRVTVLYRFGNFLTMLKEEIGVDVDMKYFLKKFPELKIEN